MKKLLILLILIQIELFSQNTLTEQTVNAVAWFKSSAEAELCYLQTYKYAKLLLKNKITSSSPSIQKKPAVVLDIDETVLDNSPYQVDLILKNQSYNSKSWKSWVNQANATPLPGALDFLNYAHSLGIEIFYISNRLQSEIEATLQNLNKYNFPNAETQFVLLKSTSNDKSERRDKISENYNVILLLGDNLTDFSEIFAKRRLFGKELIYENLDELLDRFVVFPNPMYGEWESALYNNDYSQPDSIRNIIKKENINK